MTPIDPIHNDPRTKTLNLAYRIALMVLCCAILAFVATAVVKLYTVSNQVQATNKQVQTQTNFIVNYLRCIGQVPVGERNANTTNKCFEDYAPKTGN